MQTQNKEISIGNMKSFTQQHKKQSGQNSMNQNPLKQQQISTKQINLPVQGNNGFSQSVKQNKTGVASCVKPLNQSFAGQQQQSYARQHVTKQLLTIQQPKQISQQQSNVKSATQHLHQFQTLPESKTTISTRFRSISPNGPIIQFFSPQNIKQQTILQGNGQNCSPQTIVQQKQIQHNISPIKLLGVQIAQEQSPIAHISITQNETNYGNINIGTYYSENNQKEVKNFYDQFSLQSSLIKDLDAISPQNNLIKNIYQNYQSQGLQSSDNLTYKLSQSVKSPKITDMGNNVFESAQGSQQLSVIDKYMKSVQTMVNGNEDIAAHESNLNLKQLSLTQQSGERSSSQKYQQMSSLPISEQLTDFTSNKYDEIFVRESEDFIKKIDTIFEISTITKDNKFILHSKQQSVHEGNIGYIYNDDKIQIEILEKQQKDKDNQLKECFQKIKDLESEIEAQNLKYLDSYEQIQKMISENKILREQMEIIEVGNSDQNIPEHISNEIDTLRRNIKLYEDEGIVAQRPNKIILIYLTVQKVIQKEMEIRQQLENEIKQNKNLELLVDELKYQLTKKQENANINQDEVIKALLIEIEKQNLEIERLNKEVQSQQENLQKISTDYEKEINTLAEERNHYQKEHKVTDDRHKKKHSFIQAENSYVITQLTVMKQEIEDKNAEITKLNQQIEAFNSTNLSINQSLFDEKSTISINYQNLFENEQIKYNETCSTYELEISHYKQQIQSLIDKGVTHSQDNQKSKFDNIILNSQSLIYILKIVSNLQNQISNLEDDNEVKQEQIEMLLKQNGQIEEQIFNVTHYNAGLYSTVKLVDNTNIQYHA